MQLLIIIIISSSSSSSSSNSSSSSSSSRSSTSSINSISVFHSVAVVLTLVQTKQIRINAHKRNNTKTKYKQ